MKKTPCVVMLALLLASCARQPARARNVILFLGDAGGIPTLHAASLHGHQDPQALFVQKMPHIGLMDTSAADAWVTDSAAGMSSVVTGQKTNNGVISQSADAVRGKVDGKDLETILEHAEERGLSTGVITDMGITDATAAACYAHSNDRGAVGKIFAQLTRPRYGDGPDVVVGWNRTGVLAATKAMGMDVESELRARGYTVLDSARKLTADMNRVVAVTDDRTFDPSPIVERATRILSRNPKGFFLMVEWDMHTDRLLAGIERALKMDALVSEAAARATDDTLIIYTADHSFDIRVRGGRTGQPLLHDVTEAAPAANAGQAATGTGTAATGSARSPKAVAAAAAPKVIPLADLEAPIAAGNVRVDDGHTGEQVLVAAQGPGAERVRGFIRNSDLFRIMMAAYGWETPR